MKRSRLWSAKSLTLLLVFAVLSCGRQGDRLQSTTYRLPWPSSDGSIRLQNVEIHTLTDPQHFSGSSARILVEPGDGGSGLSGPQPVGRYVKNSSGVLIPADYVTLQAVTAYAHQERLRDLDRSVGAEGILSWPLSLGLNVRLISYGQVASNNAVYDAKLDSLLLVPYDEGALPISLNPGILAHEHFHFIFQRLVMARVPEAGSQTSCRAGVAAGIVAPTDERADDRATADDRAGLAAKRANAANKRANDDAILEKTAAGIPPRVYNAYVLRGMNEGFADFYGWLYSNDDSFLARSLPSQDDFRRLNSYPGRLPSENLVRRLLVDNFHPESILPEVVRAHNAYALGSVYARYLRHLVSDLVEDGHGFDEARELVGKALIASLPAVADAVAPIYETGYLSPNAILEALVSHLPPLTQRTCSSLAAVRAPQTSYARPSSCAALQPIAKPLVDFAAPLPPVSEDKEKK